MADERNLVDEEDAVKENSTKNPREASVVFLPRKNEENLKKNKKASSG